MLNTSEYVVYLPEIREALKSNQAVVALESAVITHGLPSPLNFELAQELETIAHQENVSPATIALVDGKVRIGLTADELRFLATCKDVHKISSKDISVAIQKKWNGGTTVAATLKLANLAGISVFSTGGIGGVHRNSKFDISNDLLELSNNPLIVISSGAKSILDIQATLEYLETMGVPILGYQTNTFPEFYSIGTIEENIIRVDSAAEIANIFAIQKQMGLQKALLVANPIPNQYSIPKSEIDKFIEEALDKAKKEKIGGPKITPFLLAKVSELSSGQTLSANLALLRNNVKLANQIAKEIAFQKNYKQKRI